MAAYTSSQTGNFSASSTWGGSGPPSSDGDTFTITNGHTVTVDGSITTPTNGFGDSNIYGVLKLASSADTPPILRMDGRLYINTNGLLWCQDGAHIQITGTSGETHGIWQENQEGASVIMEGSDGMPSTTLSSNHNELSGSFAVASGANFAAGEWIAIFAHSGTQSTTANARYRDEGFWIHEVNGDTIYVREFVGPEDVTVSSHSGSDIVVSNAKKFEKGKMIIFGTGSNRNIKTISSINYATNTITCDSSISGSPTGVKVYHTGSEKYHASGDKVRKCATVSTAEVASSSTTITLANANMFVAGDEIFIEKRSEADSTTDYVHEDSDDYHHTISSVSSNTLTLSDQIGYKVVAGSLVTRLSREILIETTTPDTDYGYYYNEYYANNYNKKCIVKDVYFRNVGSNNNNAFQGVVIRGYNSTNSLPITMTETVPAYDQGHYMEGIVVRNADEHERDYGNIWHYTTRYGKTVCSVSLYGNDGIISDWYNSGNQMHNMLVAGTEGFACRHEGMRERYEIGYHYYSRCTRGLRIIAGYEEGNGIHHLIIDAAQYGAEPTNCHTLLRRFKATGIRYGFIGDSGSRPLLLESEYSTLSGYANETQAGAYYQNHWYRSTGHNVSVNVLKENFEHDAYKIHVYNGTAKWDDTEGAWLFKRRYDNGNTPALEELVYLPPQTTMRVSAKVKLVSGFSGTYPYLAGISPTASVDDNMTGNNALNTTIFSLGRISTQYTSSAASDYEEKQITIGPFNFPCFFKAGVISTNQDATEGYYIKDFRIFLDPPYVNPMFGLANDSIINPYLSSMSFKDSFTANKVRLGGRIR